MSIGRGLRFIEQYKIAMNKLADVAQRQDIRLRHLQNGYHLEQSCFDWTIPLFEVRLREAERHLWHQNQIASSVIVFIICQKSRCD